MHWMKYISLAVGTTDISVIATEFVFCIYLCTVNNGHWINDAVIVYFYIFMKPTQLFINHFMSVHHLC